jgi:hypothetical protein
LEYYKRNWAGADTISRDTKRTLDERRALLYTFFISSVSVLHSRNSRHRANHIREPSSASQCNKKIDSVRDSPCIECSCQMLLDAAEYESDTLLVASVRIQRVVESMNRIVTNAPSSSEPKAPIWMHVASLRNELQSIMSKLSPSARDMCQYYGSVVGMAGFS